MYLLVAALVIIIIVVGVVAYVFLYAPPSGNGGNGGNGGGETIYTMGNATSLQFTVDVAGTVIKYQGKNLGTSNLLLRVDLDAGEAGTLSYIMYANNQTALNNETGTWAESDFTTDWANWNTNGFSSYVAHNADWMTGDDDVEYTDAGATIKIYDIVINPTIADSVFQSM